MMQNSTSKPSEAGSRADLIHLAGEIGGRDKWVTPYELVAAAKARGINVTWRDIYGLYNRSNLRASGSFVIPTFLTEFIGAYIKDRNAQNILDPWVGIGSLLLPVMESGNVSKGVGIGSNTVKSSWLKPCPLGGLSG